MPKVYPWPQLEREYIEGNEPLREMALRLRIGEATLLRQSTRRGWQKKRREHRQKLAATDRGALIQELADLRKAILDDLRRQAGCFVPALVLPDEEVDFA